MKSLGSKKNNLVWLAGKIISSQEAKISILSPTCQYGLNVFEVIRCYLDKKNDQLLAFRLRDHLLRLFRSAKIMRIKPKYTINEIQSIFIKTVAANKYKEDITVRIVLFINESGSWNSEYKGELLISPISRGRTHGFKTGISCCISSWERINDKCLPPRIKTGANYINGRMAQLEAINNKYDSALFLNNKGNLSEAPGSCIFIVKENKLITPPITASILESVTRDSIIKISQEELGISIVERDIDRTELYPCDEVFLCGTTMEIVPVISVDRIRIGNGKIGPITKTIRQKYFNVIKGKINKYKGWVTAF
ncbi:MAG: branched-chain amino acid transaminase [Patescibacteria group bacterium]|nr:branched-chain amino acid transaminase [Patescibacteria group bacterium]